jgi:hypothetical protein
MVDAPKSEFRALREATDRLCESWDRSIRITWALLAVNFLGLMVLLAKGFGWL